MCTKVDAVVRELTLPDPLIALAVWDLEVHGRMVVGLDGIEPESDVGKRIVDSLVEQMVQTGCRRAWRTSGD